MCRPTPCADGCHLHHRPNSEFVLCGRSRSSSTDCQRAMASASTTWVCLAAAAPATSICHRPFHQRCCSSQHSAPAAIICSGHLSCSCALSPSLSRIKSCHLSPVAVWSLPTSSCRRTAQQNCWFDSWCKASMVRSGAGVEDDGWPRGLCNADMEASLATLHAMAQEVQASDQVIRQPWLGRESQPQIRHFAHGLTKPSRSSPAIRHSLAWMHLSSQA